MNLSKFVGCLLALCLIGCGSGTPGDSKKSPGGVAYYLWVASPPEAAPLTVEDIDAATLLPLPIQPASQDAAALSGDAPAAAPFSVLKIDVVSLKPLGEDLYQLRLKESPQVDGLMRIRVGEIEYQALMLQTGSRKRPLRVDTISTAAARMFLKRVEAQRSYNNVDVEQVNTLLSVVNKHLLTLDAPARLTGESLIAWYTEQAHKACTIHFSGLSSSAECVAFTLGGKVRGLVGQLQLVVNNGDPLTLTQEGPFMFPAGLVNRTYYEVTVKEQPSRQTCSVKYGMGRIHAENVDSILIKCEENRYQLSGLADGIEGPVTLRLNGNLETLTVGADGLFQFKTTLTHGEAYEITLAQQPPFLSCALSRGAGNIVDNVSDVSISCDPLLFAVGGEVNGLSGSVKLRVNDTEDLLVSRNGEFNFSTDFIHNASYDVRIAEQPVGQTCQLTGAKGRLAFSDVKTVRVTCTTNQHGVTGTMEGSKGTVTLALNEGEPLVLRVPGVFRFKQTMAFGQPYRVDVIHAPKGQQCEVMHGQGTISGEVNDIKIHCTDVPYRLVGAVTGLSGTLRLRLNDRQEVLSLRNNGAFEFVTRLVSGQRYQVILDAQPAGQRCSLGNASGVVEAEDVKNLAIRCDFQRYTLGGSVVGLQGALTLTLNGGSEVLTLSSNGMFAFSSPLQTGASYQVEVRDPPKAQQCSVRNGQGKVKSTHIVDVKVICLPAGKPLPAAVPDAAPQARVD